MKRKTHEKRCLYWYKALVLILTVCLIGCQDDKIGSNGYDRLNRLFSQTLPPIMGVFVLKSIFMEIILGLIPQKSTSQ